MIRDQTLLPWDFIFYRHSSPPPNQQTQQEQWKKTTSCCARFAETQLVYRRGLNINMDVPPYVAISDLYANYVRSERIKVYSGRLTSISGSQLTITSDTSYVPSPAISRISYLPQDSIHRLHPAILPLTLLSDLDFSKSDTFLPFLLHRETLHPSFRTQDS
jgi:hypothetical protein